jgi:hypothetical protein
VEVSNAGMAAEVGGNGTDIDTLFTMWLAGIVVAKGGALGSLRECLTVVPNTLMNRALRVIDKEDCID